jgi:hypothetical protein
MSTGRTRARRQATAVWQGQMIGGALPPFGGLPRCSRLEPDRQRGKAQLAPSDNAHRADIPDW